MDRGTLSMALGRENAVHLGVTDARAADRVLAHLSRWQFFTGWSRDAANRDSDPHTAPASGEEKNGALPTSTRPLPANSTKGLRSLKGSYLGLIE